MRFLPAFFSLAFALALALQNLPAAELPKAAEVADRIGQQVEFQDVIKAISRSRTKNGCYFSFGAPFPKQVLSVWVPEEVYFQLPHDPGLLGRKVRISGRLESSPTGPMLTMASPDQFDLLDVSPAVLAKSFLDGRMDREHFMAAVGQTFWREDFPTLDELAKELQQSHERFSDGTWILSSYFKALTVALDESEERYVEVGQKIERWRARYPASAAPAIAQAGYHLDLAEHLHGAGVLVGLKAREEGFKRETGIARTILEANPAAQRVPEYFVKMEIVAYQQEWPREAFFHLFDQAIAREPEYYSFYFQAARYLLEGAESGGWERFAEEQREQRGGGEGNALYARIAWSMSVNFPHHNVFRGSAISWEKMAAGFEFLIRQHPDSRWLKNAYANFAWQADDRVRLRPALVAVADHPDMGIWVNLENVAFAQKFADGK